MKPRVLFTFDPITRKAAKIYRTPPAAKPKALSRIGALKLGRNWLREHADESWPSTNMHARLAQSSRNTHLVLIGYEAASGRFYWALKLHFLIAGTPDSAPVNIYDRRSVRSHWPPEKTLSSADLNNMAEAL